MLQENSGKLILSPDYDVYFRNKWAKCITYGSFAYVSTQYNTAGGIPWHTVVSCDNTATICGRLVDVPPTLVAKLCEILPNKLGYVQCRIILQPNPCMAEGIFREIFDITQILQSLLTTTGLHRANIKRHWHIYVFLVNFCLYQYLIVNKAFHY